MKFSTRARYGLRVCFLLGLSQSSYVSLSTLAKQTELSAKYLEQILGKLKKGGIVGSTRGAVGGYCLLKPTQSITMNEILKALDDGFELADCVADGCSNEYCPNKRFFRRVHEGVNSILDNFTLEDMINEYKCKP